MERNAITGEREKFFPSRKRQRRTCVSTIVAISCIGVVLGAMWIVLRMRAPLQRHLGMGWVAGVANGVLIYVLNNIFGKVAVLLTDWENHRGQSEYENALIFKTFVFQ